MNYSELTKEQLLTEIDNKSKAIINMGRQLTAITLFLPVGVPTITVRKIY